MEVFDEELLDEEFNPYLQVSKHLREFHTNIYRWIMSEKDKIRKRATLQKMCDDLDELIMKKVDSYLELEKKGLVKPWK